MENERNVYRLQSTPDLVIDLGHMGMAELIQFDDQLLAAQRRLALDRLQVMFELDRRLDM